MGEHDGVVTRRPRSPATALLALALALALALLSMLLGPAAAAATTDPPQALLRQGERLAPGHELRSPSGAVTLAMQQDGNLVLTFAGGTVAWSSQTAGHPGASARLTTAGALAVVARDGTTLFDTTDHHGGPGATLLEVQDDGNVVLYAPTQATWATATTYLAPTLAAGTSLFLGQALRSPDGRFTLRLDPDGDLVFYGPDGSRRWHTGTAGSGARELAAQADGNLVLYGVDRPVWSTRTEGASGGLLEVRDDGDVIYSTVTGTEIWSAIGAQNVAGTADAVIMPIDPIAPLELIDPFLPADPVHPDVEVIAARCGDVLGPVATGATSVIGDIRVHTCLGAALDRLLTDAAADGVALDGWGWRDQAAQIRLRIAHCGGDSPDIVWGTPAAACSPSTAVPGKSMHERGLAVDFTQGGVTLTRASAGFAWLTANARRYGLVNLPSEPWHWSTNGH